jgi:hypothetical protein
MSDSSRWRTTQRSPHGQFVCATEGLNHDSYCDTYIKHNDGTLDVVRDGAKEPHSYAPGVWTNVQGDEKSLKRSGFRGWFKR